MSKLPHASSTQQVPEHDAVPRHVAIIMDGNGRWARARGLPRLAGHKAGTENIRRVLRAAVDFGMPMGPIELADTIGLDVNARVLEQTLGRPLVLECGTRSLRG